MEHNKSSNSISIPQSKLLVKLFLSVFVFVAVFLLPFYIHNQMVTGSLVNAGLLISSSLFGLPATIALSFAPSSIALLRGLLPVAFAPVIPFIIAGNILYVLIFHFFPQRKVTGSVIGSFAKFIFLYSVGQLFFSHIIVPNLLQKASLMVGWFQLITALIGAGIALMVIKTCQIEKNN